MKTIPLTQGKVALVDDADFDWLNQWKWYAHKHRSGFRVRRQVHKEGKQKQLYMHREILKPPKNMQTDHKDGNGLNNQRNNLRVATSTQNNRNKKKRKGFSSRYKGVSWDRHKAKWRAIIHLGCFDSEIEAALAYDVAAKYCFDEFAHTNFLPG